MKVAIQYSFPNYPLAAEKELIQRFVIALGNLNWQAAEVVTSDDIERYRPDFVLATHYSSPKLTRFPTLGMMINPPEYFHDHPEFLRNVLSYDGFLTGSARLTHALNDLAFPTRKQVPVSDFLFFPSTHATEFVARPPRPCHLFYVGIHWDIGRHGPLFAELAKAVPLDVYGPADHWAREDCNYRGPIRADGRSLLVRVREAGAALCIHSKKHRAWHLPTMRAFEAAAAGAVILADDVSVLREHFGDTMLPVDTDQPVEKVVRQVRGYLTWIDEHPREVAEMVRQAHAIFRERFCLERQFERLPAFLERVRHAGGYGGTTGTVPGRAAGPAFVEQARAGAGPAARAGRCPRALAEPPSGGIAVLAAEPPAFELRVGGNGGGPRHQPERGGPTVEYIVCPGAGPGDRLGRCLHALAEQSYPNVGLIAVRPPGRDGLDELLERYRPGFASLKVVPVPRADVRSHALWAGLRAVTAPFFAHLRDDHLLHPNHVASLLEEFQIDERVDLAQAASVEVRPDDGPYFEQWNFIGPLGQQIPENRRLVAPGAVDPEYLLDNPTAVSASAWIARRGLLDDAVLQDPNLPEAEDIYLFALLLGKGRAVCAARPTCEWHVGPGARDEPAPGAADHTACLERVRRRLGVTPSPRKEIRQLRESVRLLQQALDTHAQHTTTAEAHASRRLSQGYFALRGFWKVLARPHRLPGRLWRGSSALVRQGLRKVLSRLVVAGRHP